MRTGRGAIIDETGKRYSMLLVLGPGGKRANGTTTMAAWRCLCDCGRETIIGGTQLRRGKSKSCGCQRGIKVILPPGIASMNAVISKMKSKALGDGREWLLPDDIVQYLIKLNCHYCGSPPSNCNFQKSGSFIYNGLDRMDSRRGYSVDNVVPCCRDCNLSKRERTVPSFLAWIARVNQHSLVSQGHS